ncbi:hypothetical protein RF55_11018 [Lasius niger]|uniref:Retroviral polymerase SH3-like domain-containing protein n=1 Tax=Lasius niger TaxID=67767 RepID=A0A0J7KGF6_LASNI|nr:hypothetical protein RF55_11018 [Lasius niger]
MKDCEFSDVKPDAKRSKLGAKAQKLTFVGYSNEHKGYRFLNRATDRITISRDARFIELGNGSEQLAESDVTFEQEIEEDKMDF